MVETTKKFAAKKKTMEKGPGLLKGPSDDFRMGGPNLIAWEDKWRQRKEPLAVR